MRLQGIDDEIATDSSTSSSIEIEDASDSSTESAPPQLPSEPDIGNEWNRLCPHKTPRIRQQLISIGDCIWYSTNYNQGENGMVEYCTKLDTITNIIKYPQSIQPQNHSCCKYKDRIYIIDGYNGQIVLFYTSTKQFIQIIKIPKIGESTCCVVMYDNIHIFHGSNNQKHLIYSINDNKIEIMDDDMTKSKIQNVCILRYKQKLIRFGGWDINNKRFQNEFIMSSSIKRQNECKNDNISWIIRDEYKLPAMMAKCGCLLYKHYIIIFGGTTVGNKYMNKIYVLDLRNNGNYNNIDKNGWIELENIKCPLLSTYLSVLNGNMVHLFSRSNKLPEWEKSVIQHYSISISTILSDLRLYGQYKKYMTTNGDMACIKFMSLAPIWNATQNNIDDLDENIDDRYQGVMILNNKLSVQIKEIKKQNQMKNKKIKQYEKKIDELIKEKNEMMEKLNHSKENEISLMKQLKMSQNQLIQIIEPTNSTDTDEETDDETDDDEKEKETEKEKQIKTKKMNNNHYKQWTKHHVIDWMVNIDHDDIFKKYQYIQHLFNQNKPKNINNTYHE